MEALKRKSAHALYGGSSISREALKTIQPPTSTESWKPVPHHQLVDMLSAELARRDMGIIREEFAIQRKGHVLLGVMDLNRQQSDEHAAAIGIKTSNDKSFALQLIVGARSHVSDALVFSGHLIALKRRHTAHFDPLMEISRGLDRYQEGIEVLGRGIQRLKETEIHALQAKELMYDIFAQGLVPSKFFYAVARDYAQAVASHGSTLWVLYGALAKHVQNLKPAREFRCILALGKFFRLGDGER